jgi:hypothetical protein
MNAYTTTGQARIQQRDIEAVLLANRFMAGAALARLEWQRGCQAEADAGLPIKPRDFSDASQFVAASDPKGIYLTFTTGLDGTPMPSFADFLPEEQRWQLVWYVMSLRTDFDLAKVRAEMQGKK